MSPSLALLLWFVLLVLLWRYDAAEQKPMSPAAWLALFWLFIVASRLPSQWWQGQIASSGSVEEGNDFDRNVYIFLILSAIWVLGRRKTSWSSLAGANAAIVLMLAYGLLSVAWAEFPFVAMKRWFRDLGTYLVILVTITVANDSLARRTVLRRLFFLLIPLSIVMNKYYPYLAREFDHWTGKGYFIGVTTSKNMLGVLAMLSALFFIWDILRRSDEGDGDRARQRRVDVAMALLSLLLLADASSATSSVCLVMGALVIVMARLSLMQRRPGLLIWGIPLALTSYLILQFGFDIDLMAELSLAVGREPDLTGRTHIWSVVLSAGTNPLIGTGYENFWLGPRLEWLNAQTGGVNHAHNGYLETYLNLGLLGLFFQVLLMLAAFRKIAWNFRRSPSKHSLALALWTVLLFYNVTEAAFRGHLLWVIFLMLAIQKPAQVEDGIRQEMARRLA